MIAFTSTYTKTIRRKRILEDPSGCWFRNFEDPLEDGILLKHLPLDKEFVPKFSRQIITVRLIKIISVKTILTIVLITISLKGCISMINIQNKSAYFQPWIIHKSPSLQKNKKVKP
jgi:hypothetical protein